MQAVCKWPSTEMHGYRSSGSSSQHSPESGGGGQDKEQLELPQRGAQTISGLWDQWVNLNQECWGCNGKLKNHFKYDPKISCHATQIILFSNGYYSKSLLSHLLHTSFTTFGGWGFLYTCCMGMVARFLPWLFLPELSAVTEKVMLRNRTTWVFCFRW